MIVFNQELWFRIRMGQSLISTNQVQSNRIKLSDNPYDKTRPLGIVDHDSYWYIPFTVQQPFSGIETKAPTIEEYNDCTKMIYVTSDNRWVPSGIQLPHHSLVIGDIECSHPEKYTDKSEYDVLIGSISIFILQDLRKVYQMRRIQSRKLLQRASI